MPDKPRPNKYRHKALLKETTDHYVKCDLYLDRLLDRIIEQKTTMNKEDKDLIIGLSKLLPKIGHGLKDMQKLIVEYELEQSRKQGDNTLPFERKVASDD